MKVPFSPPFIDDDCIDAVVETLKSGWITTGPKTKLLESQIKEYTTSRKVVALNSATAALELALRYLGVGEGDEVIIPAYTYCATANVVMHVGAKPIMVDIGEDLTISPIEIQKAISEKTKAIIPVDFGGLPCNYSEIRKIVETNNLFKASSKVQEQLGRIAIIADAAHSLGALFNGKPAVIQADFAAFSFHAVKNLTTAEGGALCINLPKQFLEADIEDCYKWLYTIALHGQSKDAMAKFNSAGNWEYDVIEAGFKCNMPDTLAALGVKQMEKYPDQILPVRESQALLYKANFGSNEKVFTSIIEDQNRKSSCHVFSMYSKDWNFEKRNEIIQKAAEIGVSLNVHFKPLPLMSFYKGLGYNMNFLPKSQEVFNRVISLPIYHTLTLEQQEFVITTVKNLGGV